MERQPPPRPGTTLPSRIDSICHSKRRGVPREAKNLLFLQFGAITHIPEIPETRYNPANLIVSSPISRSATALRRSSIGRLVIGESSLPRLF